MINKCTFCSLYETSECNCLGGYNIKNIQNPPIMVVSDYVRQRYTHGYFTGAVTRDMDYVLKSTKIKPEDVFFTGLVRCAPPVKNKQQRNPSKEEVEKCSVYLEEEIYRVKPKVIIACGVIAFEYFFPKQSLSDEYCQIKWSEAHQTFVIGTYHPEIMVTSPEYDLVIQKAFQQARDFLDNKVVKPETNYVNITTLEELQTVVNRVQEVDLLSFDLETSSKIPYKAKILSIGLSWKVGTGVSFPLYIKDEEAIAELRKDVTDKQLIKEIEKRIETNPPLKSFWGKDHAFVVEQIKKILLSPAQKGGHNSFFDCSVLHFNGFSIKNYLFDTMIMMHLLDEERPKDLDYASWTLTDKGGYKMVKNKYLTTSDTSWAHIPTDILLHYNAGDADVTLEIYHKLRAAINLQGKAHLLDKICMPLQKRLLKASWRGMQIDKPYVLKIQKEMSEVIKGYIEDIQKTVSSYYPDKKVIVINDGDEKPTKSKIAADEVYFNLNSIKDLKDLFIDKMKLKITQTTKKGNISLGESTLNFLAKKHDIAYKIVQYRKKNKLKSTYVDGIFDQVDDNFVAHSTYRVDGTVTGRLASKNPNCQNIPKDATIKRMFVARPGYKLAEIDMSQHELRVLAGLSNDPVMNKIYAENGDIHMETAVSIFKLPANQISEEQRTIAKTVNFGIGYGMEYKTLMQNLADADITVSKTQAQKYIQAWKDKYKIAWSYLQANVYKYQNHLVLRTPSGRERHAYRMFLDKFLKEAQLREGQNFEIQSYASDLVYEIIIDLVDEIEKIGAFFINTVHDSIIIEYPEDKTEELAKICKRVMWRSVPALHGHMIKSDMAVSVAWGDKKKYDMEKLCFKEK